MDENIIDNSSKDLKINDEDERQKIKAKLSEMSFEDLQKLKQEMGTKLYTKTVFGDGKRRKVKTDFKRANKNRPREMSSKKIISLASNTHISVKKTVARDPRFESICGTFDRKTFKSNYKFLNDVRKKEKKQLEEELKNTTDSAEKKRIKLVLQRLNNQIYQEETEKSIKEKTAESFEQGKRLQFKKKSVKKLESLIDKFEELKKTNKIQKHIERKSKKITVKERKKLEKQKLLS